MDGLVTLLIVVSTLLFTAALPYVVVESRWRWRWREVEAGRLPADGTGTGSGGIYRAAGEVPRYLAEAPRLIRWTAFTCFLFGQMFIPGLLIGLLGLISGVGLVSIPGLITAAKLYGTGLALLRREPRRAWFRAHSAATWALWLNGIILSGSVLLMATPLRPTTFSGFSFTLFVDGYSVASILQALLVRRAIRVYEDALFASSAQLP